MYHVNYKSNKISPYHETYTINYDKIYSIHTLKYGNTCKNIVRGTRFKDIDFPITDIDPQIHNDLLRFNKGSQKLLKFNGSFTY